MSSTRQAASSTSRVQLIIEAALTDYTKNTGIDLSKTSFAAALEQSNSPEAILQLLYDRENAFKEHRDGNRKLINCLSPAVNVIQAFSGIIGEAVNPVSLTCPSGDPLTVDLVRSPFHQQTLCLLPSILSLLYVPSTRFSNRSPVMNEYTRLPVGLHRATMLFSSCSSAWGISSSVWRFIR
jgi:hypothetical protein